MDDRPTDTGHHERRRVASLSYVEPENVRHNVEEGSEKPPKPRIRGEQELTGSARDASHGRPHGACRPLD